MDRSKPPASVFVTTDGVLPQTVRGSVLARKAQDC